jgi:hypothetical protein
VATGLQGASDDILNAKNMLYQHLTWDPDKTISLCSKLALPLATPAVGVTPPVSPKSTSADGEHGVNTMPVQGLVLYVLMCKLTVVSLLAIISVRCGTLCGQCNFVSISATPLVAVPVMHQ